MYSIDIKNKRLLTVIIVLLLAYEPLMAQHHNYYNNPFRSLLHSWERSGTILSPNRATSSLDYILIGSRTHKNHLNQFEVTGKSEFWGNLKVNGELTAQKFIGDGSLLTNLPGHQNISFHNDNIAIGPDAGLGIHAPGKHIFIGAKTGKQTAFDQISLIDYEDQANHTPVTGSQFLQRHSVFVLNNHSSLERPLLFGKFAAYDEVSSSYTDALGYTMPQLGINTHHLVDSAALTVSGAVHIGPKALEPTLFPSDSAYSSALLWVERGIVTEDVTYMFTDDWSEFPDYVFDDNYALTDLQDLEAYIATNKHLPGIKSQQQVKSSGLQAKAITVKLLEKIEELTLYTIEQHKQLEQQQSLNDRLIKKLEILESKVDHWMTQGQ